MEKIHKKETVQKERQQNNKQPNVCTQIETKTKSIYPNSESRTAYLLIDPKTRTSSKVKLVLVRITDYCTIRFTSMCQSTIQMSDNMEFIHHSYIHNIFGLWK